MVTVSRAAAKQTLVKQEAVGEGLARKRWLYKVILFVRRLIFCWPIDISRSQATPVPWVVNTWLAAMFGILTGGILAIVAWTSHRADLMRYGSLFFLLASILAPVSLGTHLNLPYLVNELFATLRENGVIRKRRKPDYADFRVFSERLERRLNWRLWGSVCLFISTLYVPYRIFRAPIWSANPSTLERFWGLLAYGVEALALYWGLLSMIRIIIVSIFISRLMRFFRIYVTPLHPDGCGGLEKMGHLFTRLIQLAAIIGLATVGMAVAIGSSAVNPLYRVEWLMLGAIYLVELPMLIIAFLLVPHSAMVQCRSEMVAPMAKQFSASLKRTQFTPGDNADALETTMKQLSEIALQIRTITQAYPVWPIQVLPLQRAAVTALLPIIIPVLSAIILKVTIGNPL